MYSYLVIYGMLKKKRRFLSYSYAQDCVLIIYLSRTSWEGKIPARRQRAVSLCRS